MILKSDFDDFYAPPFLIDVKTCGVWESIDCFDDLESALAHASQLVGLKNEDQIRILDKNNKII